MRISDWSSDVCSSDLIVERVLDHFTTDDGPRAPQQQFQQVRFPARQIDSAFTAARRSRRRVKLEVAGFQNRLPARAGAAEERANTRRSEEHTSELQSLMRLSYAVFCLTQTTQN